MNTYLAAKLAVMRDVKYLKKNKTMQAGGSYTYVGEAMIVRRLRRAMIENGISVSPVGMKLLNRDQFQTAKGGTSHSTILKVTWRFVHESGEGENIETIGEAADHGDKATNKAMTAAKKYALLLWGLIETGDDPDDTHSDQYRRTSTQPAANGKPQTNNASESKQWSDFAAHLNTLIPSKFKTKQEAFAEVLLNAGPAWNRDTIKTCTDEGVFNRIRAVLSNGKEQAHS